jgi:hypothetical protein
MRSTGMGRRLGVCESRPFFTFLGLILGYRVRNEGDGGRENTGERSELSPKGLRKFKPPPIERLGKESV